MGKFLTAMEAFLHRAFIVGQDVLYDLTKTRLTDDQVTSWREVFDHSGLGSVMLRPHTIEAIHDVAAPRISAAMTSDGRQFLRRLHEILREAIKDAGGQITHV